MERAWLWPWAFFIDNHFVGWGGIQPEIGESDLAMVLHPEYWGIGKSLLKIILEKAFGEMGKESVIILFPNTRTRLKGIYRIGFKREKEVELNGQKFILFRLRKKDVQ